jgi:hypothetical protein
VTTLLPQFGIAAPFIRVGWMPNQARPWCCKVAEDRPLGEIREEGGANFVLHPRDGAEPHVGGLKTFVELSRPEGVEPAQEFPSQGTSRPLASADAERFLEIAMTDDLVEIGWHQNIEKLNKPLRQLQVPPFRVWRGKRLGRHNIQDALYGAVFLPHSSIEGQ